MRWEFRERRKTVRIKLPCEITVRLPHLKIIPAYLDNIGPTGVCIITREPLKKNSSVILDIYGIMNHPLVCRGKVTWSKKAEMSPVLAKSVYFNGVEFTRIQIDELWKIKNFIVSISPR